MKTNETPVAPQPRAGRVGVILVHYHTPDLLVSAVEALKADAAGSGLELAIVVVDNGSTAEENAFLQHWSRTQAVTLFEAGRNGGYSAGLNAGAELLTEEKVLLLMNPDVLIEPGCLAALLARIDAGVAVSGPAFFWDEGERDQGFELPPTEAVGMGEDLLRVAAARFGGFWVGAARRRWRRHARRYFLAGGAIAGFDLSGAMMMVEATTFHRIGGFDDRYALYFEETDFLQRLRLAGQASSFEPRARAIHLYAQSTPRDGRSARLYAASQERFRESFYGRSGASLLRLLSRGARPPAEPPAASLDVAGSWPLDRRARWLEVSPSPLGFPAAARRLPAGLAGLEPILPPSLVARMAPGTYWLRTLDEKGHELDLGRVEIAAQVPADQTRSPSPSV